MSRDSIHFLIGAPCTEFFGCGDDASCRIDHVIIEDAGAATDITDRFNHFGFVMFTPSLMDDGKICPHDVCKDFCLLCAAGIGRDDDRVSDLLCLKILGEDRACIKDIDRDGEESLDLIGVEIKRDDVIRAGFFKKVGSELGGDWFTWRGNSVLTRIGEVWEDDVDCPSKAEFCGLTHEEELYESLIRLLSGGLEKIDIFPADGFFESHVALAATKTFDDDTALFDPESLRKVMCEGRM